MAGPGRLRPAGRRHGQARDVLGGGIRACLAGIRDGRARADLHRRRELPPGAIPPANHRPPDIARTIDYGVVLDGQVDLELDDGSVVTMARGDVVVQRGKAYAWHNHSSSTVRLVFVNVDGEFTAELRSMLGDDALSHLYE